MPPLTCKDVSVLLWALFILGFVQAPVLAVDLPTCNRTITEGLNNGTIAPDDSIFFFDGTKHMSDYGNLQLTIDGCRSTCPGAQFGLYKDLWPRLMTWLIPVLLLVGNLHVARVGNLNRFFVLLHFIGDPIDSAWSLMTKAEVWSRFYAIAKTHARRQGQNQDQNQSQNQNGDNGPETEATARALAALLSAFEELTGDMARVHGELQQILDENGARLDREDLDYIMLESAEELVDSRSNEVLRTSLVIFNYLWSVLEALVEKVGGPQSSVPGGRIGTAMFLSWLVTLVMLSNTMSGFISRRTCLRIMERYCRTVKGRNRDVHVFPNSPLLRPQSGWVFFSSKGFGAETGGGSGGEGDAAGSPVPPPGVDYIDAQPWNGGVYSFRPRKRLIRGGAQDRPQLQLLLLSVAPVPIAAVCALVMLWFTPTRGLDCRGLWVVSCAVALLASPGLTWLIHQVSAGRLAWHLTVAKDALIGGSILTVIVCSSIGVFNTCTCWSSVFSRASDAFVTLDPEAVRIFNGRHLYPAMVATCLGLQLVVFVLMYRVMTPGGRVFRPDEDDKMESYRRVHGFDGDGDEAKSPRHRRASSSWSVGTPLSPLTRTKQRDAANDGHYLPLPAVSTSSGGSSRGTSPGETPETGPKVITPADLLGLGAHGASATPSSSSAGPPRSVMSAGSSKTGHRGQTRTPRRDTRRSSEQLLLGSPELRGS